MIRFPLLYVGTYLTVDWLWEMHIQYNTGTHIGELYKLKSHLNVDFR
jgi:hypothetical protein